jgi:hypothetical protein
MERKREALSLEKKYDTLWEIEKGSKAKTEIAKNFQIPKSKHSGIVLTFLNQKIFKMEDNDKQSVCYM